MSLRYVVRSIQINKLGKERFMPEGAEIDEGWEPFAVFFGNAEPWLLIRRKIEG